MMSVYLKFEVCGIGCCGVNENCLKSLFFEFNQIFYSGVSLKPTPFLDISL